MATSFNAGSHGYGQRRQYEGVSTASSTCIPMQMANLQGPSGSGMRSDCWNSPLCPRNMPQNSLNQNTTAQSCGSSNSSTHLPQHAVSERSLATEVFFQNPMAQNNTSSHVINIAEQDRPSMKRARTTTDIITDIKIDPNPTISPTVSPKTTLASIPPQASSTPATTSPTTSATSTSTAAAAAAAGATKEKRLPHHVIERRYRENLNSQIESLRAAVPSTSACLNIDMEDIGTTGAATNAIRPLSKAAVIAHAAEYMRQLAAQNEQVERANRELRVTVEALRRLVNCEDCGVVQQIVDAGA